MNNETQLTAFELEEDFEVPVLSRFGVSTHLGTTRDDDLSNRYFNCLGEIDVVFIKSPNKHSAVDEAFQNFGAPDITCQDGKVQEIRLFRKRWDKGSVLHSRMSDLFKMARKEIMTLAYYAKTNTSVLSVKSQRNAPASFALRRNCVDLYSFLNEYFSCIAFIPEYEWCYEELLQPLCDHVEKFQKQLGTITSLDESIFLHASNPLGNKCDLPSYHLFHLHLDSRWMHINLFLVIHKSLDGRKVCDSQVIESLCFTKAAVSRKANCLMFELIDLALLRFEKLYGSGCYKKSPFSCSCVQDVWIYLHRFHSLLYDESEGKTFWNSFCGYIEKINGLQAEDLEYGNLLAFQDTPISTKVVFSLWLLSNLAKLYKSAGIVVSSNYNLMENLLKLLVSDETNESDVKTCLVFIESLCIELWEPKVEPIVCLWEYFYKKINSSFYVPGSSIDSIATLSKTANGLLRHVRSLVETKRPCASTSYQHFIRLIGLHLQRTRSTPRHWNVIKGRVFSKMSGPKLGTLSQTGEHHVVMLFVMLAIIVGISQVEKKFVDIISAVRKAKGALSTDLIQGQMAFIVISLNEKQNVAKQAEILVEHINSVSPLDGFDVLKRFTEEVQEIFSMDDLPGLGLHILLDSWMSSYLTCCSPAESSRLMESMVVVVNRLKIRSYLGDPDQETVLFVERLWEQLNPYFNGMSSHLPIQTADLAASLVVLFTNIGSQERASGIMNNFIAKDCGDVWLARKFITRLIVSENVLPTLSRYNKIIIRAWIRCSIICTDTFSTEMKSFTNYISNLEEISSICCDGEYGLADAKEPLLYLCSSFRSKFETTLNIFQKQNLREKFTSYLDGIDKWLKSNVASQDQDTVGKLYRALGNMVKLCSHMLYAKSKPNTALQQIVDTLLLPAAVRNPAHKLSGVVIQSIKESLHLFFEGLHSLHSNQDSYIMRIIKELVTAYIPRCVHLPSPLPQMLTKFALVSEIASFKCDLRCLIFENITSQFLKKKAKVPHHHACHALKFFKDVLNLNGRNVDVVKCFIRSCFERLCDMTMFCDDKSATLSHTKSILKELLNNDILRENSDLMDYLSYSLAALCNEHLAWSSRQIFDLIISMSNDAPDLVARFLPQLLDTIKHIETKRGVGYDKSLRFGLERIESNLRSIKSDQDLA